jgi:hypothetical protein
MEVVVAPLLHKREPVKLDAVSSELAQLFTTVTAGAAGMGLGAAMALPLGLIHPSTVWVTV